MVAESIALIFVALIVWVTVANVECMFLHARYGGSMKRGVAVWSEKLPVDMKHFLRRLPGDVVDETGAFIRKEDNTVLVQYLPIKKWWRRRGVFEYVAYIDLRVREPKIQYRVPISPLPFVALWMALAVWASFQDATALLFVAFWVLMFCWAHTDQRKRILRFIREKMQTSDLLIGSGTRVMKGLR
jgi:hypothetical protein